MKQKRIIVTVRHYWKESDSMRWTFKKINENDLNVLIGYSHGHNESCDGIILYDKKAKKLDIEKLSEGCDRYDSERAFQYIYGLLSHNELTTEPRLICTG